MLSQLPRNPRQWLLLSILAVLAVMISNLYFKEIREIANTPLSSDFYKFYLSSQRFYEGDAIYWPALPSLSPGDPCYREASEGITIYFNIPAGEKACLHPNMNPPILSILILPLSLLDYPIACWIFSISSLLCGAWALLLILHQNKHGSHHPYLPLSSIIAAILIFYSYFPVFATISYGQISLFLLLLLTKSWIALRNNNQVRGGFILGIAASIKPFIGLFFIALLFSKNWRAATAFTKAFVSIFLIGGLITGFQTYNDYLVTLKSITWYSTNWNASFVGFFSRLFGGGESTPWIDAPSITQAASMICCLLITFIIAKINLKTDSNQHNSTLKSDIIFLLTIPAMLIMSPLGWLYYFPLLIISINIIFDYTKNIKSNNFYRILLVLLIIPTSFPSALLGQKEINTPYIWLVDASMYFYILLSIFGLAVYVSKTKIQKKNAHDSQKSVADYSSGVYD